MDLPIGLADVEAAARRIEGAVVRTPTWHSPALSERLGAEIWLKLENLQHAGAFKARGALNKLLLMDEATRARGVTTASAGNHAQALAFHAQRLGIPAAIVMPEGSPVVKIAAAEAYGAEVILHGAIFDEAYREALRLADDRGFTVVHPFDDYDVMAGQGTAALELLADATGLEMLIVPIGGGGLISGMGVAAKALRPEIEIVGVQSELYPSMFAKFARRELPCAGDTIAEGIAVKAPGMLTSGIINQVVDDIVLVPERVIEQAIAVLARTARTVAEGAGAAALAALLADPGRFRDRKVGIVVSGGNIDAHLLANVLLRDLVRSGRMARLRIRIQDRPGVLHAIFGRFAAHQVNIVEVEHQRIYTALPAKDAVIEVECEARGAERIEALVADLRDDGFAVEPAGVE